MKLSFRLLAVLFLLWACIPAQAQTTTITGTIRDLSNALVTSGQVTFELQPPVSTAISGTARFTRSTVTCTINGSGLVKALDGVSACTLLTTTATSPGAGYKACILPAFADEGNCFNIAAIGSTLDISTVVFTPTTSPAILFVDTFSTQTITGAKTFSGGVTFSGSPVFSGNASVVGTFTAGSYTNNLSVFAATTSAQLAGVLTDESGTGVFCMTISCVMTTPNIGVATGTSLTTGQIIQTAATIATWKDNSGGTRASIPSNGTSQGTLNNWLITGGSTYGGTTLHVQTFASSGTFTIPANITTLDVIILGGGGAGGGSTAANNGGGGGAGGYAEKVLSALTPGNTITVTVGGGGAGSAGVNGGAGTASSISSGTQTIATVTANGGSGGQSQAGSVATPGLGGTISTGGDINGFGVNGYFSTAGTIGGAGGSTFLGGGGLGGPNSVGSIAGTNTGSGGGGAGGPGSSSAGGNGAAGIVIFRWVN